MSPRLTARLLPFVLLGCLSSAAHAEKLSIQAVSSTEAPYTGVYMPASPAQIFNGENGNGTWTLNVSDLAFGDLGSVRAFSLDITGYDCSSP